MNLYSKHKLAATLWLKLTLRYISYSVPQGVNMVILGNIFINTSSSFERVKGSAVGGSKLITGKV